MRKFFIVSLSMVFLAIIAVPANAQPQPSMYTLDDIYYYLAQGAETTWGAHSLGPPPGVPGQDIEGFTKSLSDIYYYMVDSIGECDAAPGQVMNTVTFFNTDPANWGQKSGAIQTQSVSNSTVSQNAGYYDVFNLSTVDGDLATANIKKDITIFGVSGDSDVVNTSAGDASAGDILSGKKAYVDGSQVTGNISSKGAQTYTPGTSSQTITVGQYLSGTQTISGDADLTAAEIKDGVNIFNVVGTFPSDGTAVDTHVLATKTYYSTTSTKHTGSMPTRTLSSANDTVNAGYYAATTLHAVDADLTAAEIKDGTVIFGVTGTFPSDGNAAVADVLLGKTYYSNTSTKHTGSIASKGVATYTPGTSSQTIAAGQYLSGAQTISGDADLTAVKIKDGTVIFGVTGTFPSDGNATDANVLATKTYYSNTSARHTGSIASKGVATYTPGTSSQTIAAGQYLSGTQTISGDADLTAVKIKDGTVIFGVTGTFPSDGDATDANVLATKTYYSNTSTKHTGSIASKGVATYTPGTSNKTIDAGQYLSGTQTISGDADLVSTNIRSGANIFGVAGDSDVVNTSSGTAAAGDIKSGKVAWVDGASVSGNISTVAITAANDNYPAGYHAGNGGGLDAIDTDLATANIKKDVVIFGITGTASGAGLPKTGQTTSYATGDDGDLEKGKTLSYTDHGDGTVTDNATGLMWAKDGTGAGCYSGSTRTWLQALTWANGLSFATYTDWRLPNVNELYSICMKDATMSAPYINHTYFPNTVSDCYWSSTSYPYYTGVALFVGFNNGSVGHNYKATNCYVRAVRGGE